jgi:bacteriophage HK97-gp10 putative tail-component
MAISRVELQKLIDDFGEIPADLRRELPKAVKEAAKPMLGQMKANSAWSTRIPSSIRLSGSFSSGGGAGIRIIGGNANTPHAVLYEGLHGDPFRAPLYGDREHWYPHAARPFFYKAVNEKGAEVVEKVGDAVMEVVHRHGF